MPLYWPKYEGCVRCMLIMILATAVTAMFEYNNQEVETIHKGLGALDEIDPVEMKNIDDDVQWIFSRASMEEIEFEIEDPVKSSGENCGGGPKLIIDKGPDHCLYGMTFHVFTVDEDSFLQLTISFRNSQDNFDKSITLSELYKKPDNPAQDLSKVVHVEPIPRQQLAKARNKQSFVAPVSWVEELLDKGIYGGKGQSNSEESVGDTADTDVDIRYTAYPVVMDADILDQILEIRFLP